MNIKLRSSDFILLHSLFSIASKYINNTTANCIVSAEIINIHIYLIITLIPQYGAFKSIPRDISFSTIFSLFVSRYLFSDTP